MTQVVLEVYFYEDKSLGSPTWQSNLCILSTNEIFMAIAEYFQPIPINTCIPNAACRVNVFRIHKTHLRQGSFTILPNEVAILQIMTGPGGCRIPATATYEALVSYEVWVLL